MLHQAQPHVVEVCMEGHGHGGHALCVPPVGRATPRPLLQRVAS